MEFVFVTAGVVLAVAVDAASGLREKRQISFPFDWMILHPVVLVTLFAWAWSTGTKHIPVALATYVVLVSALAARRRRQRRQLRHPDSSSGIIT